MIPRSAAHLEEQIVVRGGLGSVLQVCWRAGCGRYIDQPEPCQLEEWTRVAYG